MNIEIKKYNPTRDYEKLIEVIELEGEEWKDYLQPKYQESLERSITYVAYVDGNTCGYSRSMNDSGFYIWVLDLLVAKKYRGNSIGKKLLECLAANYPDQETFVMSDVDEYYEKLGYAKEGSIFKIE
jgi:GNAT superfamily N-acetyltransferase